MMNWAGVYYQRQKQPTVISVNAGMSQRYTMTFEQMDRTRWARGAYITFRGRLAWGANGPNALTADSIRAIIANFKVTGYSRATGKSVDFINVKGPALKQYVSQKLQANLRDDYDAALIPAANGSYDIDVRYYLPFGVLNAGAQATVGTLLDLPNYNNVQIEMTLGDDTSIFNGQTVAGTFTAYGSGAGLPAVTIQMEYAQSPDKFVGLKPARVWMTTLPMPSQIITAAAGVRLNVNGLPRGNRHLAYVLRTGQKNPNATNGQIVCLTRANILDGLRLKLGQNNILHEYSDFASLQDFQAIDVMGTRYAATGAAMLDFVPRNLLSAFRTDQFIAGSTSDTDLFWEGDINTSNANNMIETTIVELVDNFIFQ